MKSPLVKEFFREIRKNPGRFFSLFLIVLLGTAFFAGVRSAGGDMRISADQYYDETKMMDLRVLGTLGLTDDDIADLRALDGVEYAQGAYTKEALWATGGDEYLLKLIGYTDNVNHVYITEGRLPENDRECLADKRMVDFEGTKIGDTITVFSGTDSDISDDLTNDTYTITGFGYLPYFLDLTRGVGSIGDGSVDAFLILPEDTFTMDYYTEAYVRTSGTEELLCYSDEYIKKTGSVKDAAEGIADAACERRYDSVYGDASEELADAKQKLADAEQELADAAAELADGRSALEDARQELAEKKEELENGKAELAEKKEELESAKAEVSDGREQLEDAKRQLEEKKEELESAKEELAAAEQQLSEGRAALDDGQAQLAAGEAEIAAKERELADGKAAYQNGLAQYEAGEQEYLQNEAALEEKSAELAAGQAEFNAREAEYNNGYEMFLQSGMTPEEALAAISQLRDAKNDLEAYHQMQGTDPLSDPAYQTVIYQLAALEQLEVPAQQLIAGKAELEKYRAELADGSAEIEKYRTQLNEARAQLDSAKDQLDASLTQIREGEAALAAAKTALAQGRQEIAQKEQEYQDGLAELEDGKNKIRDGEEQLADAEKEIAENEEKLAEAEQEIADGEEKLSEAESEIEEGSQAIADAESEIAEKEAELIDGEEEYLKASEDAQPELDDARKKIADGEKQLSDLKKPEWYIQTRSDISSYDNFHSDAGRIDSLANVFPVIFFIVAALVALNAMTRMVEEQRVQIGTLKAIGYSDGIIAMRYFGYAMLATVSGGILGVIIGERTLPMVIINAYQMLYTGLRVAVTPFNMFQGVLGVIAAVLCTGLATLLASYAVMREKPASIMLPKPPAAGRRIFLEYLPFIWKLLSFSWKATARNLFRYKKRFIMTLLGIGGSMSLMLVGFGLEDSITVVAKRQFAGIFTQDAMLYTDTDFEADSADGNAEEGSSGASLREVLDSDPDIAGYMNHCNLSVDLQSGGKTRSAVLYIPESANEAEKYISLGDRVTNEHYDFPERGAAIAEKTAGMLGLSVGDTVTIRRGESYPPVTVEIVEIVENYVNHYIFISSEQYEELYGEAPEYNVIEIIYNEGASVDEEALGKRLMECDECIGVSFISDMSDTIDRMLASLNLVIYVLIISAALLAFVVLFNLNSINITERYRELATLKVLGFYDTETAMYVYRENILLTVIGIVVGIFLGMILHQFTIRTVEVDLMMFGRSIGFFSYVKGALLTFAFSLIVNLLMLRRLQKIDMIEALKSVD